MAFLAEEVWPLASRPGALLQHDSFSCDRWGGGAPFPTRRIKYEFVGARAASAEDDGAAAAARAEDERLLRAALEASPGRCLAEAPPPA